MRRANRTRVHAPRRGMSERAAQLVEFALVVPIFLLLVMGIVDFSIAFNEYNSVRSGVAEGARQGVVANFDDAGCSGSSSVKLACLTKNRIGLDATKTKVKILLPDAYAVGDPLRVCAMYDVESITGMFNLILDDKVSTSSIDMRIEKLDDANPLVTYEETPLSGENWSWC